VGGPIGIAVKMGAHCLPKITSKEAMQTVLPIDGAWKRIDTMTAEEFLDCAETLLSRLPVEVQRQTRIWLYALDYSVLDYSVDEHKQYLERWYALDNLLRLGVELPVPKKCEVAA
jgi:hypothetical protein